MLAALEMMLLLWLGCLLVALAMLLVRLVHETG